MASAMAHTRMMTAIQSTPPRTVRQHVPCGCARPLVIATSSYTVTQTVGMASGSAPNAIAIIPSSYYYDVAGTHGGWTSAPSSPAVYTLGWNVGGWQ
jgi:hypothetical protein